MMECDQCLAGWMLEARFHFGHQLSQYVGISVYVKQCGLSLLARTSSLLLCVGFGSYLAYRLCLKLLGCQTLSSLLARLKCNCFSGSLDKQLCTDSDILLKPCRVNDQWSSTESFGEATADDEQETISTRLTAESKNYINQDVQPKRYNWRYAFSELSNNSDEPYSLSEQNDDSQFHLSANNNEKSNATNHNEIKRTRALSDDDPNCNASTSSGSLHSPPPIQRRKQLSDRPASMAFRDDLTSRCSSSLAFNWDPVCTPGDLDEVQFRALDEALRANLDGFYNPASLIDRFLASLDNEASLREHDFDRHLVSPGPSEYSEFSLAADKELGDNTADNLDRLHEDLNELKEDVQVFSDEFGRYFDERKLWVTSTDYSKEIYRSVVVPSSSSDTASVAGSSKSCPSLSPAKSKSSRKRWSTCSLNSDDAKKSKSSETPTCSLGTATASFYDSYHTQISADLHGSQISDATGSDGKRKSQNNVALTSSFVDSCISIDFRSVSSGSSENLINTATLIGTQLFVPSLGVTPEDRDGECASTSGSIRPCSLEWDDMENGNCLDFVEHCAAVNCNRQQEHVVHANIVDLAHYVRARYPEDTKSQKVARHLAKRRGLLYVRIIEDGNDSLIRACLDGARSNRMPLFKCATFQTVKEALEVCLKRCSYVSQYFSVSSTQADRLEDIGKSLELLWQYHDSISNNNMAHPDEFQSGLGRLVQGVKVLMVLRVVEVYEQISFTRKAPKCFYNELFRNKTPRDLAKQLSQCGTLRSLDELEIALLTDTLGLAMEVYRFHSSSSNSSVVNVYPDQSSTAAVPPTSRLAVGSFGCRNFMPLL